MGKIKTKNNQHQKKFSFSTILYIIGMIAGLYAYQYYMRPEINVPDIKAQYARSTREDNMRIEFSFQIKNNGKSRTKSLKLYSAFPKWAINQKGVTVAPHDFVYSDVADLLENQETNFSTYKDINPDDFIQYSNMAQGIYLVVVLRWQGDNLVFLGRTFENHKLFFLRPGMKDNKMVFQVQQIEQKNFTYWFMKDSDRPNIFKVVEGLGATKLLYGDISRFD